MANFRQTVDNCELIDVGFSGPNLTWNNRRAREHNIQERLDRFFASESWMELFFCTDVKQLGYNNSNHRPIVLYTRGS